MQKYGLLRSIIEDHDCPAIVYVSRTRTAAKVATRLRQDGFSAGTFHGKMETRMKTSSQNDFIDNKIRIMVATSAFGMGVDKEKCRSGGSLRDIGFIGKLCAGGW